MFQTRHHPRHSSQCTHHLGESTRRFLATFLIALLQYGRRDACTADHRLAWLASLSVTTSQATSSLLASITPATFTSLAGWRTVAKEDFEGVAADCGSGCYFGGVGIATVTSIASSIHRIRLLIALYAKLHSAQAEI